MTYVNSRFKVVLHTVSQISFSPLWQILDIGIMVKLFAQVFLIQTSVVSYLIDKAGPFGFCKREKELNRKKSKNAFNFMVYIVMVDIYSLVRNGGTGSPFLPYRLQTGLSAHA